MENAKLKMSELKLAL